MQGTQSAGLTSHFGPAPFAKPLFPQISAPARISGQAVQVSPDSPAANLEATHARFSERLSLETWRQNRLREMHGRKKSPGDSQM